ncbi:MAG: efflux RND transporter periplasmic adaptor subunit [Deltaproteobacteria bacterium]|nr:efflux RND transporter periplasmic adaptor subunit [Deltaproteobacteria bacterium]
MFFFISLLPVIFLSAFGCEKREAARSQQEQRPVDVAAITVNPKDVPVTYEYIAQVQSSRQVSIQARVNGFLERRVYTEGAIVKEGQILFLMDQKPFKVQLEQAKAALARQQAAFDVARQNLARVKPLAAANALSQKDLDDATGQFQSAAAAVEQAKATVEQAKLNLSYTVITSPVTGITSSAEQADGTYLNPSNSQLTTVTVISPAYVNFSISENDRLRYRDQVAKGLLIEPKDRKYIAEVVLADGSIYPHMGKVTFADPSFNARTGTFLIRSTVENPDGLLRPNQYVRIRLKGALRPNAILVPQRAVQQGSKGHFVWVVDKDDKAELRPVVVGEWHENDWFIYEGLHTGDRVVVDGVLPLRPGTPVKVNTLAEKG